jgi:hypothetical protein
VIAVVLPRVRLTTGMLLVIVAFLCVVTACVRRQMEREHDQLRRTSALLDAVRVGRPVRRVIRKHAWAEEALRKDAADWLVQAEKDDQMADLMATGGSPRWSNWSDDFRASAAAYRDRARGAEETAGSHARMRRELEASLRPHEAAFRPPK